MKSIFNFVKQIAATTLGIALFFSLAYHYVSYKVTKTLRPTTQLTVQDNSILRIKLSGEIVEHVLEVPSTERTVSLSEINAVLGIAAEDPKIQGLYIELDSVYGGLDSVDALRQAFAQYKEKSQKPIVIYAAGYGQVSLALASVADHIILHPSGTIILNGFSMHRLFYKRLLDRFDVEPMLFRGGKYKVESMPYVSEHMADHDKKQWMTILQTQHNLILDQITTRPSVKLSDLHNILQNQPILNAQQAKRHHLIDAIGFSDQADIYFNASHANTLVFQANNDDIATPSSQDPTEQDTQANNTYIHHETPPNYITYNNYIRVLIQASSLRKTYTSTKPKIVIIPLEGSIVSKDGEPHTISEERILPLLQQYADDDNVIGFVITMDSPGGYSIPTANIAHTIERIEKDKPIVCLIVNGAYSGGYYIAAACTKIIASSPGTPIGSIGSWMMFLNLKKAAAKHLSIDADGIKTHEHANIWGSQFTNYTEQQKQFLQQSAEYDYQQFQQHVQRRRHLTNQETEDNTQGKIFTAQEAKKRKLIDDIATSQPLETAIDLVKELAAIDPEDDNIQVIYPQRILNMKRLGYIIRGLIQNQEQGPQDLHGQKMYHTGYNPTTQATHT